MSGQCSAKRPHGRDESETDNSQIPYSSEPADQLASNSNHGTTSAQSDGISSPQNGQSLQDGASAELVSQLFECSQLSANEVSSCRIVECIGW